MSLDKMHLNKSYFYVYSLQHFVAILEKDINLLGIMLSKQWKSWEGRKRGGEIWHQWLIAGSDSPTHKKSLPDLADKVHLSNISFFIQNSNYYCTEHSKRALYAPFTLRIHISWILVSKQPILEMPWYSIRSEESAYCASYFVGELSLS